MTVKKYEYMSVKSDAPVSPRQLNELGQEGWLLVSCIVEQGMIQGPQGESPAAILNWYFAREIVES